MARDTELTAKIKSTGGDKVQDQLEQIADAAEELEQPINVRFRGDTSKVTRDIDEVLQKVDRLAGTDAATLTLTSNARKIADEIAGLVLEIDDLDASDPTITAKVDNIKDLEAGLDRLSTKAKDLTGQEINLRTEGGRKGFDDLVTGADQANSAIANMVGNSAQDMGELAGVTGSAGVAVGQLAEYFTDSAFAAREAGQGFGEISKSFIAAAGPIAAISAGIFLVTAGIEAYQAPAKAAAERTKQLGEAMKEGGDDSLAFANVLRENSSALSDFIANANDPLGGFGVWVDEMASKVPLVGGFFKEAGVNIYESLNLAGESIYSMARAMDQGGDTAADFRSRLQAAKDAGKITGEQFNAVSEAFDNYAGSAEDAAKMSKGLAVSGDEVAAMLGDIAAQADPLSVLPGVWRELAREIDAGRESGQIAADAVNQLSQELGKTPTEVLQLAKQNMDDLAKATEEATSTANELAAVLSSDAWATSTIDAATSAWERFGEAQFAATNIAAASEAAYDSLGESIANNGLTFDTATKAGRDNAAQIQELYSSLIPALSKAYADADGSVSGFRTNMDTLRSQTLEKLTAELGGNREAAQAVVDQLGVFDGSTYSSNFQLLGLEDATTKLGLLSGVIGSLPEDIQKRVTLAVQAGDPQAALDEIDAWAQGNPATVHTTTDPTGAQKGIQGVTDGQYDATVDVGGNNKEGKASVAEVQTTADKTKPVIDVGASITQALITMAIINAIAKQMAPTVDVHTNIGPAIAGLMMVAAQRPRVPVEAYLSDYPTAGEIAARIGRPRIPVDIVVGQSIRITGVRE